MARVGWSTLASSGYRPPVRRNQPVGLVQGQRLNARRSKPRPSTCRKPDVGSTRPRPGSRSCRSGDARCDARNAFRRKPWPVRHYDWIAHFGRRTPDKVAVIDLASERRLVLRAVRRADFAPRRASARPAQDRARRPGRGAGAQHHRYAGGAVRLRAHRRGLPAPEHPPHRARAAVHRRRRGAASDDP